MFRRGIISVLLSFFILASGGLLYAEGNDSPFFMGQSIDKYKISSIDKHPEYWRLDFAKGTSKTGVA